MTAAPTGTSVADAAATSGGVNVPLGMTPSQVATIVDAVSPSRWLQEASGEDVAEVIRLALGSLYYGAEQ